jgi:hypothetical protein
MKPNINEIIIQKLNIFLSENDVVVFLFFSVLKYNCPRYKEAAIIRNSINLFKILPKFQNG